MFENYDFNVNRILYAGLKEDTPRDRLIKYRLMNGLTQREMAERLGVSFSTFCRWENLFYNIKKYK